MQEAAVKTCNRCKIEKQASEFYKSNVFRDGLTYCCKECSKALNSASRAKAMQTPEGRERLKASGQRWQKKKRANDPQWVEKRREYTRKHYREHKEEYCHNVRSRTLRLRGIEGTHSLEAWRQLKSLFGNKCLCCGAEGKVTKDHITPVSRGGSDDIRNIQPLCMLCNKSKFTRDRDFRTRDKVVLEELNAVGKILFGDGVGEEEMAALQKHKPISKTTGVYFAPKAASTVKPWRAIITVDKRRFDLGRFATVEEASESYNKAAKLHRGEQTCVNDT